MGNWLQKAEMQRKVGATLCQAKVSVTELQIEAQTLAQRQAKAGALTRKYRLKERESSTKKASRT